MTRMLASVTSVAEAEFMLRSHVDIIDIKDPARGALGAQPVSTVRAIVAHVDEKNPVSATIGDVLQDNSELPSLIDDMAATGVDIVKVGLFDKEPGDEFLKHLTMAAARNIRIVVVVFAEHYQFDVTLPALLESGVHGVMIDTGIKNGQSLCDILQEDTLYEFVHAAQTKGMLAGLAGSLRYEHIDRLIRLEPDYLGFRGALCREGKRNNELDKVNINRIRQAVQKDEDIRYDEYNNQKASLGGV